MGLSAAYAALRAGWRVQVLDRAQVPTQASWAGAGLLTAAHPRRASHPLDRLCGQSNELYERWSHDLLMETGIDNEYRRCGGFHVARSRGDLAALAGSLLEWHDNGVEARWAEPDELTQTFGAGFDPLGRVLRAVYVPDERQVRNPRHLRALRQAIDLRGGQLAQLSEGAHLIRRGNRLAVIAPGQKPIEPDHLCLCAGAWTQRMLEPCGIHLPVAPVRGQMLLYRLERLLAERILYDGNRYIVPRQDGHVLVGATVEEVGFDCSTTVEEIQRLQQFAVELHGSLSPDRMVRSWAGLRPASFDGLPYLGRLSGIENCVVATALFRHGLQLAPVFAELVVSLFNGKPLTDSLELFSPQRALNEFSNLAVELQPKRDPGANR